MLRVLEAAVCDMMQNHAATLPEAAAAATKLTQ